MNRDSGITHNSHEPSFRSPFGAVCCLSAVRLGIAVTGAPAEAVTLRLWTEAAGERLVRMEAAEEVGGVRWHRAAITAPPGPDVIWYYFIIDRGGERIYYGNNGADLGGVGEVSGRPPASYQITVYDPDGRTPDWFKETVVYQIFPDRFASSAPGETAVKSPPGSLVHAYWNNTPFYIRERESGHIFAYDFFGGDLAGIAGKLDYLTGLGIGAIYLNPVFKAASNHRYDTADYRNIDPMLGDNEAFASLCHSAGRRGISILLDGVFSHTGSDSVYFNRESTYPGKGAWQSSDSPYYPWYRFERHPDRYESWWGVDSLPNVNETEPSFLDFIIRDPDSVLRHWLRMGAKGWRLDVADELPDEFITLFRSHLKSADPESVLIGEVWEDASRKISYGRLRPYFSGRQLDSVTNYLFRDHLVAFLTGSRTARDTARRFLSLKENYPPENFYALLNLLGSHDVPRILTVLGDAPPARTMTSAAQARFRLEPDKRALAVARLKLAVLLQMTFPGVPCIYYGDEAGTEGYSDPFNRSTYPWGGEDAGLIDWYRRLVRLRNRHPVLRLGAWEPLAPAEGVFGHIRRTSGGLDVMGRPATDGRAVVLVNRDPDAACLVSVTAGTDGAGIFTDALTHEVFEEEDGVLKVTVSALGARLLLDAPYTAFPRSAGVLLHPTSLPGPFPAGDFGPEACRFVDFLADARQRFWQILPLNPPGYGDSPYQALSAFAGNELLISPERLVAAGLLPEGRVPTGIQQGDRCSFAAARQEKEPLFREAFRAFAAMRQPEDYAEFIAAHAYWLDDYALFRALRNRFDNLPWNRWPDGIARRDPAALAAWREDLAGEVDYYKFLQYCFDRQWAQIKAYAAGRGVTVIGDLPIYVAHDSSDVWARPELFDLRPDGSPRTVAGVPPDYFSDTGQLWGNPLYNWQEAEREGYSWWISRFRHALRQTDVLRLDHFRGFEAYWEIPGEAFTAESGRWVKGPAENFFAALEAALGRLPVIAEDLGVITPAVEELRDRFAYPGMRVLHFAFEDVGGVTAVRPFDRNTVIYSGTHDNDTSAGWLAETAVSDPDRADRLLAAIAAGARRAEVSTRTPADAARALVGYAHDSPACLAVVPLQDVLGLGSCSRMNRPGTVGGNWEWRCRPGEPDPDAAAWLARLTIRSGRC